VQKVRQSRALDRPDLREEPKVKSWTDHTKDQRPDCDACVTCRYVPTVGSTDSSTGT
jgi:hypothetical protein